MLPILLINLVLIKLLLLRVSHCIGEAGSASYLTDKSAYNAFLSLKKLVPPLVCWYNCMGYLPVKEEAVSIASLANVATFTACLHWRAIYTTCIADRAAFTAYLSLEKPDIILVLLIELHLLHGSLQRNWIFNWSCWYICLFCMYLTEKGDLPLIKLVKL